MRKLLALLAAGLVVAAGCGTPTQPCGTFNFTGTPTTAPGEYITVARRRGGEWFLGSMTNWQARDLDLPLTFLGAGRYRAEIYADAPDADRLPKNTSIVKQTVDRSTHLKPHLAPAGGYAVRLVPLKP